MGVNISSHDKDLTVAPKRLVLAASIAALFCGLSAPALAADTEEIVKTLRDKGVISEAEYQEMQAAKGKEVPKVSSGPSLRVESADGQHSIGVTGRLQFDYRDLQNDYGSFNDRDSSSLGDGFEIRRARIGVNGKMFKDITYEVVTNLVGSGDSIDTGWMNLGYVKPIQLRMGKFKQPFSLEQLTSSNNIDFMERSYNDQLVPGKKLGVMLHGEPLKGMTYAVSHFQQGSRQTSEGDGFQNAARVTANISQWISLKDSVLHLGVAGTDGHYQVRPATSSQTSSTAGTATRATIVGFNSENRGLPNVYRAQIGGSALGTGAYSGADEIAANVSKEMSGLELALAFGPFKFQGEMVTASFDANHQAAGQTVVGDVDTDYFELVWNVTGEKWSDAYRAGAFSGIKPNSNFKPGSGWGGWQVAVRLSTYDASDMRTTGTNSREQNVDKGETLTLGVNWLLNTNVRFMLNYSDTTFKGSSTSPAQKVSPLDITGATVTPQDSEQVISLRGQISF